MAKDEELSDGLLNNKLWQILTIERIFTAAGIFDVARALAGVSRNCLTTKRS
jgi:hypothetical protein